MSEENNIQTEEQQTTPTQAQNVKTDTANVTSEQAKTTAQKSDVTYSKIDYDSMAVRQYNAGITKAMKDAGFDGATEDDFKKNLKAFKVWQDSQKTELQLAQEAAETAKKEKDVLQAEITAIKQEKTLRKELKAMDISDDDITDELIETCRYHIGKFVNDDTDFQAATSKWLKETKLLSSLVSASKEESKEKETPPPYIVPGQGTVKAKPSATEEDILRQKFNEAQKLRNTSEMSRIVRLAQSKGIKL